MVVKHWFRPRKRVSRMSIGRNLKNAIFEVLQPSEKNGHYYALLLFSKICDDVLLTDALDLDSHKLSLEIRKKYGVIHSYMAANKVEVDGKTVHVRFLWDDEFRELDTWKEMKSKIWILFSRELFDAIGFNKKLIVWTYDERKTMGRYSYRVGIGTDSIYWHKEAQPD